MAPGDSIRWSGLRSVELFTIVAEVAQCALEDASNLLLQFLDVLAFWRERHPTKMDGLANRLVDLAGPKKFGHFSGCLLGVLPAFDGVHCHKRSKYILVLPLVAIRAWLTDNTISSSVSTTKRNRPDAHPSIAETTTLDAATRWSGFRDMAILHAWWSAVLCPSRLHI